jgi:hypothetical protein
MRRGARRSKQLECARDAIIEIQSDVDGQQLLNTFARRGQALPRRRPLTRLSGTARASTSRIRRPGMLQCNLVPYTREALCQSGGNRAQCGFRDVSAAEGMLRRR